MRRGVGLAGLFFYNFRLSGFMRLLLETISSKLLCFIVFTDQSGSRYFQIRNRLDPMHA